MAEQCTGRGARGVVCAAAPLAAALGLDALRRGGNAYDAALTAALAETVLLPPKCGLGGDLVALCASPGTRPSALLAIGTAPARLADALRDGSPLTPTGGLSVGPPGAPAGYAALAERARAPLATLAAPAIELAESGVAWSSICSWLAERSADLLRHHQPHGTRYLPDDRPPATGQVLATPGLARALQELADRGADIFSGPIADAITTRVAAAGGVLDHDDLTATTAEWLPAPSVLTGGIEVWATPGPTHGATLLDALAHDGIPRHPAAAWATFRDATARRRATLGDGLDGGTSMVTAVDDDGTAVTVIHSNSFPEFGSGLVVEDWDLILNNRAGRGFTPQPGHPNFPLPGRRPATTLHAWAAGPVGDPTLIGGTPGGANQVSWNLQALARVAEGDAPGHIVTAPLWEWNPTDDGLVVEEGFTAEDLTELATATDGPLHQAELWALRSAQQVAMIPRTGAPRVAATDPRTQGAALGW